MNDGQLGKRTNIAKAASLNAIDVKVWNVLINLSKVYVLRKKGHIWLQSLVVEACVSFAKASCIFRHHRPKATAD